MFALTFPGLIARLPRVSATPTHKPPRPRAAPVFIGDAVQPFAGATMLLTVISAERPEEDQS